jgi:hypothetical protein
VWMDEPTRQRHGDEFILKWDKKQQKEAQLGERSKYKSTYNDKTREYVAYTWRACLARSFSHP